MKRRGLALLMVGLITAGSVFPAFGEDLLIDVSPDHSEEELIIGEDEYSSEEVDLIRDDEADSNGFLPEIEMDPDEPDEIVFPDELPDLIILDEPEDTIMAENLPVEDMTEEFSEKIKEEQAKETLESIEITPDLLNADPDPTVKASGTCGTNLTWSLENCVLTISGTGDMTDYNEYQQYHARWYSQRDSITTVIIEPGVTSIGNEAFSECRNLTSVSVPDGVTRIGDKAFQVCTSLPYITLPESVTSIGYAAFKNCSNLNYFTFPSKVTTIESYTFAFCDNNLTGMDIPETITTIKSYAFAWSALCSVTIPESVTSIGFSAFRGCAHLGKVAIPGSITEIEDNTFESCGWMTSVTISDSVVSIGKGAFSNCYSLEDVFYSGSLEEWDAITFGEYNSDLLNATRHIVTLSPDEVSLHANERVTIEINNTVSGDNVVSWSSANSSVATGYDNTIVGRRCGETTLTIHFKSGMTADIKVHVVHTVVTDEKVDPTCTEPGISEGSHCSACNEVLVAQEEIPAAGHSFGEWVTTLEPTVLKKGSKERSCENCDETETEEIPALDPTITVNPAELTLKMRESEKIEVSGLAAGDEVVSWESSDEGVATVLDDGTVTGKFPGTADITVTLLSGLTKDVKVTVSGAGGTCGDNLCWSLYDGVLTVFGAGDMWDYSFDVFGNPFSWGSELDSVTSIVIEPGATHIGSSAFSNFNNVTEVSIPDSVTSIGEYAFYDCFLLQEVEIPDGVAAIGEATFHGCQSLTEVVIPDGVTSIGNDAFGNCRKLQRVNIPDKVTTIGNSTFFNCLALKDMVIPAGVTNIEKNAFGLCSSMETITFEGDAPQFDANAFASTTTTAFYPAGNAAWTEDVKQNYGGTITWKALRQPGMCGDNAFWKIENGVLTIYGTGEMDDYPEDPSPWEDMDEEISRIVIEDGITGIGEWAFYNCINATEADIASSVSDIRDNAFFRCSSLTEVTIPDGVATIKWGIFHNCSGLKKVNLPDSVTNIEGAAFWGCSNLESIKIPEGMTTIDNNTFDSCSGLQQITIPDSVKIIDFRAFAGCTGLTELTVPAGVGTIYAGAFSGCTGLRKITFEGEAPVATRDDEKYDAVFKGVTAAGYHPLTDSWTEDTRWNLGGDITWEAYVVPGQCGDNAYWKLEDGVLTIYGTGDMYDYHDGLSPWTDYDDIITKIDIQDGITGIGEWAFHGCAKATEAAIADSVLKIGDNAFHSCSGLTEVTIPDGVETIGWGTFHNCSGLKKVNIPDSVLEIEGAAFWDCSSLTEIDIPESSRMYWLRANTFDGCSSLKEVIIPDTVIRIGSMTFQDCTSLTEVTIPASVETIFTATFKDCTSLKTITFEGDAPVAARDDSVYDAAFKGVTATGYYPGDNPTWTEEAMWNFGGDITWVPYFKNPTITVSPETVSLVKGKTQKITVSNLVYGDKVTSWKSADTSVAAVGADGTITAKNAGNTTVTVTLLSGKTGTVKVKVTNLQPAVITGLFNSSNGGDLRWKAVPEAESYEIYRTNGGKTVKVASVDGSLTSFMDTSIKDNCWGKVYVYYVRSRAGSALSERGEGKTLQRLAPMKIIYSKNDKSKAATIKWDVQTGTNKANGYELQYAENTADLYGQKGTFKKVGGLDTRNSLSKTVTGLTKGKTYYFRVRAYVYYTHSVTHVTTKTWSQYSPVASVKISK